MLLSRLAELYARQEVQLSLKEQQEAQHRIKHIYRYRPIFAHSPVGWALLLYQIIPLVDLSDARAT